MVGQDAVCGTPAEADGGLHFSSVEFNLEVEVLLCLLQQAEDNSAYSRGHRSLLKF